MALDVSTEKDEAEVLDRIVCWYVDGPQNRVNVMVSMVRWFVVGFNVVGFKCLYYFPPTIPKVTRNSSTTPDLFLRFFDSTRENKGRATLGQHNIVVVGATTEKGQATKGWGGCWRRDRGSPGGPLRVPLDNGGSPRALFFHSQKA